MARQAGWKGWWAVRSVREKRLLITMLAVLALVLIWLAIIRPLMDAEADARARLDSAVAELAQARADAALAGQEAASSPVPGPVAAFLTQAAGEQGFTNMTITASGPTGASLASPQVRPAAFFAWIGMLEARGLVVESMTARANQDQTISVQALLRARGQ